MEDLSEYSFDIRFNILEYIRSHATGRTILTSLPVFPYPHIIPCQELLQDIPGFFRTSFSYFLPDDELERMTPGFVSHVRSIIDRVVALETTSRSYLIPLVMEVQLPTLYEREDREGDRDMIDVIVEQSMQQVATIPTSKEAIASLKKLKGSSDNVKNNERCSICLESFEEDDDVSRMPCDHIYHENCIVKWLKTNHTCPLCRFQMPTE